MPEPSRDREIITHESDVKKQSDAEWLAERFGDEPPPAALELFEFVTWSTRRDGRDKGRLVLIFKSLTTGKTYPWFANVEITHQRGARRGEFFEAGRRGRFWPLQGSKFVALWRDAVGDPPKLSTIYRQMGLLKGTRFRGQLREKPKYTELIDLELAAK